MMFLAAVLVLIEGVRVREPVTGTALGLIAGAAIVGPSLLFYSSDLAASAILVASFGALGLATSSLTVWIQRWRSIGDAQRSVRDVDGISAVTPETMSANGITKTVLFRLLLRRILAAVGIVGFCVSAWGGVKWYVASNREVNPLDRFYILVVNDIADEMTVGAIMLFAGAAVGVLAVISAIVLRRKQPSRVRPADHSS